MRAVVFSDAEVASLINRNFVAVWESVRPVPKVTIDFGNGKVVTRTLNGNIATYFCTSEGKVFDILPGLYSPKMFAEKARNILSIYKNAKSQADFERVIREYHKALTPVAKIQTRERHDMSKMATQRPLKENLGVVDDTTMGPKVPHSGSGIDIVNIEQDNEYNTKVREPLVHAILAERPLLTPNKYRYKLYKEVLNVPLDDQYLGLGDPLTEDTKIK